MKIVRPHFHLDGKKYYDRDGNEIKTDPNAYVTYFVEGPGCECGRVRSCTVGELEKMALDEIESGQ